MLSNFLWFSASHWMDTAEANVKADTADFSNWWMAFNGPVLNSLIEQAYQQNPPLQIAGICILEARAQLGIAVGNSYPQQQSLGDGVGHVEVSESQPNFSSALDNSYRDSNLGFDMAWELDIWGRFQRGIEPPMLICWHP